MKDVLTLWGKCVVATKKKKGIPTDSFGFVKGSLLKDCRKAYAISLPKK
jgi:hypothetical protein